MKKLYKDPYDKMLFGVCSGIAKYFDIDPTIIRLIWAFASFFAGSGLLVYIICAIVIPEMPTPTYYQDYENQKNWEYQQQYQPYQPGTNYYNPNNPDQQNQGTYYDPNSNQK